MSAFLCLKSSRNSGTINNALSDLAETYLDYAMHTGMRSYCSVSPHHEYA